MLPPELTLRDLERLRGHVDAAILAADRVTAPKNALEPDPDVRAALRSQLSRVGVLARSVCAQNGIAF